MDEAGVAKDQIVLEGGTQAKQAMIVGNSGKVQQVIMNLLQNARDAIHSHKTNSGRITIDTQNKEADPRVVILRVTDNGCGISKEHIDKIFESFFTTKEMGKGTGLGLSIALSIVKAMKGEIRVHSTPGEGTTFDIEFPTTGS